MTAYDGAYYDTFRQQSFDAGVKLLSHLKSHHPFRSVVDIGCGAGTWILAAKSIIELSGEKPDLLGIDGEYGQSIVDLSTAHFMFLDLENRVHLPQKFDLAICLEVAEHLSRDRASTLVEDLCAASDTVFFSAAIPGQGGANHINEQWQDYWHSLFSEQGFFAVDFFKQKFWNDTTFSQCPYYVANSFVYVQTESTLLNAGYPIIPKGHWSLKVAHPSLFYSNHFETASFPKTVKSIPRKLSSALARRVPR